MTSLIDPDCCDGRHGSCVGGPCQCPCHDDQAARREFWKIVMANLALLDEGAW